MAETRRGVRSCDNLGFALKKNLGDRLSLVRTLACRRDHRQPPRYRFDFKPYPGAQRQRHCKKGDVRRLLLNVSEVHDHLGKKRAIHFGAEMIYVLSLLWL